MEVITYYFGVHWTKTLLNRNLMFLYRPIVIVDHGSVNTKELCLDVFVLEKGIIAISVTFTC